MLTNRKLFIFAIFGLIISTITCTSFAQPVLYSGANASQYADQWWNSNNPNYITYSSDCTNYACQCIKAGGCNPSADPQSYYDDQELNNVNIYRDEKGMIINCNQFNGWLRSHSDLEEIWTVGQPSSKIVQGDIIIFGPDGDKYHHTTIVAYGSSYNVQLNAHTSNRYREPYTFFFGTGVGKWNHMLCYHITTTGVASTVDNYDNSVFGRGCFFSPISGEVKNCLQEQE
jgi:hypothetical protein